MNDEWSGVGESAIPRQAMNCSIDASDMEGVELIARSSSSRDGEFAGLSGLRVKYESARVKAGIGVGPSLTRGGEGVGARLSVVLDSFPLRVTTGREVSKVVTMGAISTRPSSTP